MRPSSSWFVDMTLDVRFAASLGGGLPARSSLRE
jgi:hypothetical protein